MKIVNATLVAGMATMAGMAGAQAGLINVGDQLAISGTVLGGSDTGYVSDNGGTSYIHCYAGAFNLTVKDNSTGGNSFTIQSFCTDAGVTWKSSDTYTAKDFSASTDGVNPSWSHPGAIQDVAYLYNTYFVGHTLNNDQDAGLQLAIWKVLYDSDSTGKVESSVDSFTSGKLEAYGFGSTAMSDALAYVGDVNSAIGSMPTYTGLWLDPNDNNSQGLIYTPTTPTGNGGSVPEPSTIFTASLLLLPLGVGIARTLRKQRA